MKPASALIIFAKNLVYGSVKTRLAATVGNDKAMEIYRQLLLHTNRITQPLIHHKIIFYSHAVESNDNWDKSCQKQVQQGFDLGERMKRAFVFCFAQQYQKAVIIGTDCPELTEEIINDAFVKLDTCDVVLGPAYDGGYYLLGMKKLHESLFDNIPWSTHNVYSKTIQVCKDSHLNFYSLPTLHDVDEEKDLQYIKKLV